MNDSLTYFTIFDLSLVLPMQRGLLLDALALPISFVR